MAGSIPTPENIDPVAELDPSAHDPRLPGFPRIFQLWVRARAFVIVCCSSTHEVGVIGIGGLGHLVLQFLNKWGCEVTAFTSSAAKADEARKMGAHLVVNSKSDSKLEAVAGKFDCIISTVNADLNWPAFLNTLAPKGRLHLVGVVPEPVSLITFPLIAGQRSVSGTPLGNPATTAQMLEFCARHDIAPVTESFKMSEANEAFEHLEAGKARYRIVLENGLDG